MTRAVLSDFDMTKPTFDRRLCLWCARLAPTYPGRFFDTREEALAWLRKKRRRARSSAARRP